MSKFDVRAKKDLDKMGYLVAKSEHWNAFAKRKIDLFGVFDFVGVSEKEIVGVQITSRGNMSSRRKKIQESDVYEPWLAAGGIILLLGYDKMKSRWRVKIERHTKGGIKTCK